MDAEAAAAAAAVVTADTAKTVMAVRFQNKGFPISKLFHFFLDNSRLFAIMIKRAKTRNVLVRKISIKSNPDNITGGEKNANI